MDSTDFDVVINDPLSVVIVSDIKSDRNDEVSVDMIC